MIAKKAGVRKKTSMVWSVIASTLIVLSTLELSPSARASSELQQGVNTVRFAMTHSRNYVAQGNDHRIGTVVDLVAGMGVSSVDDFARAGAKFAKANADNVTALAAKHAARHFAVQAGGMTAGAGVGAAYGYSQGGWEGAIDGAFSGAQIGSMLGGIGADLLVACFAAGTPLVVGFDGSSRPIDEIEVNDLVLARNEFDPNGPLELKRVEEKFVRVAVVMELVIQGQSIKTTAEHPFFVPAQHRFVTAGELKAGDQLVSHDGQLITVASVCSTEAVTTVYNLRVADHHTYFVGGNEWGWDVWVHNAKYVPDAADVSAYSAQRQAGKVDWSAINPALSKSHRSAVRQVARSQGIQIPTPNPHGSPGDVAHKATVSRLVALAKSEFPGFTIKQGASIKKATGLARSPDVWVESQGQVLKVYEAARKRLGNWVPREMDKLYDYNGMGISSHFMEVD